MRFLEAYLSKVPFPEERIEFVVAELVMAYSEMHRDKERHPQPYTLKEFLHWADPWSPKLDMSRYSDVDKSFLRALG